MTKNELVEPVVALPLCSFLLWHYIFIVVVAATMWLCYKVNEKYQNSFFDFVLLKMFFITKTVALLVGYCFF
jgi:hypothetical protein